MEYALFMSVKLKTYVANEIVRMWSLELSWMYLTFESNSWSWRELKNQKIDKYVICSITNQFLIFKKIIHKNTDFLMKNEIFDVKVMRDLFQVILLKIL